MIFIIIIIISGGSSYGGVMAALVSLYIMHYGKTWTIIFPSFETTLYKAIST